jgi:hypothetical protein
MIFRFTATYCPEEEKQPKSVFEPVSITGLLWYNYYRLGGKSLNKSQPFIFRIEK